MRDYKTHLTIGRTNVPICNRRGAERRGTVRTINQFLALDQNERCEHCQREVGKYLKRIRREVK